MTDPQERGINRSGQTFNTPERCRFRTLVVPRTFGEFEGQIEHWMAGCVVTTSIRDERGLPLHREHSLMAGNTSLQGIWNVISHHAGTPVRIEAVYNRRTSAEGFHVRGITFHLRTRVVTVTEEEPSIP